MKNIIQRRKFVLTSLAYGLLGLFYQRTSARPKAQDSYYRCSVICQFPTDMTYDDFVLRSREWHKIDQFNANEQELLGQGKLLRVEEVKRGHAVVWHYVFKSREDFFDWFWKNDEHLHEHKIPTNYRYAMTTGYCKSLAPFEPVRDDNIRFNILLKRGLSRSISYVTNDEFSKLSS